MLLAIDVGNTNIVIGAFRGSELAESWRIPTLREQTADAMGILLVHLFKHRQVDVQQITGVIVASVVPALTGTMSEMSARYFGQAPLVVDSTVNTGMPVLYENPADVGADRVVNGVAAYEFYGKVRNAPLIVVDFGTATTFDAISAAGEYLGGVICPGIQISADALFQRAARLPRVEVRKPASLIGRTTVGSMQSGLFYGYVAMVEGLVHRMREELGGPSQARDGALHPAAARPGGAVPCIATGGMAEVISPETSCIDEVNPDLTLQGLRIVWERNM
jgi:type III pantothenate kinase